MVKIKQIDKTNDVSNEYTKCPCCNVPLGRAIDKRISTTGFIKIKAKGYGDYPCPKCFRIFRIKFSTE